MSILKRKLSGSTDGMGILVAATATPGTTIHTAVSGTTAGTYDEIWLWAQNNHTADVVLTIEYGDATTSHNIKSTIPYQKGLYIVLPGFILQNGMTVKAFAGTANVITIYGYVHSLTD